MNSGRGIYTLQFSATRLIPLTLKKTVIENHLVGLFCTNVCIAKSLTGIHSSSSLRLQEICTTQESMQWTQWMFTAWFAISFAYCAQKSAAQTHPTKLCALVKKSPFDWLSSFSSLLSDRYLVVILSSSSHCHFICSWLSQPCLVVVSIFLSLSRHHLETHLPHPQRLYMRIQCNCVRENYQQQQPRQHG